MCRRRLSQSLALALVSLVAAGCYTGEGSGNVVIETYAVDGFDRVVLNGDANVAISSGEYAVSVSAEDDVVGSVRVERRGTALILGREVDWIDGVRPTVPIAFRVTLPSLASVRVSGSGRVAIRGMQPGDALTLAASGSGEIDASPVAWRDVAVDVGGAGAVVIDGLAATTLRCSIGGSGRVTAVGMADEVAIDVGGSGLYRGSGVRSTNAAVDVGGAGQAFVWAEGRVDIEVAGAGRVTYRGAPVVNKRTPSDDQVIALDDGAGGG